MKTLTITRVVEKEHNTLGIMVVTDSRNKILYNCITLELPYKDNQKQISCIPKGTYRAEVGKSEKFGNVIYVKGVTNRQGILVHVGNYTKDTHGCILVGNKIGYSEGIKQHYIGKSKITMNELLTIINNELMFIVIK
jgi:hypothetical protein